MANRSTKPQPSRHETRSRAPFIWGLILLSLALLVLLALVSYTIEDRSLDDLTRIQNWIGPVGAAIGFVLIDLGLGRWAALGIPVLIGIWGWTLLRRLNWQKSFQLSAWLLVLILWISTFFGLLNRAPWFNVDFLNYGKFGEQAAELTSVYLGLTGALIIMVVILIVGLGLSVARFAGWFETKVNDSIDKVSQVRLPKVKPSWWAGLFKKKETSSDDDLEIEPSPAALGNEGVRAEESPTNGFGSKEMHDLSRPPVGRKLKPTSDSSSQMQIALEDRTGYIFPPLDLFNAPKPGEEIGMSLEDQQRNAELLEKSLATFGVQAKVVRVNPGPVITRFDLEPAPGVKVSRIEALADDIALALKARGLRILAPIPGMAAVGIEMANMKPALVTYREVVESPAYQASKSKLTIALGRTVSGEIFVADLGSLPHLLIAGTTGSGKSVCVNTIITSILLRSTPEEVQFVMIDPKKLELSAYNELRNHHVTHRPDLSEYVITKPDEAVKVLRSCLIEMERRYDLLAERGAKHLREYNELMRDAERNEGEAPLPYIVVIIDELADLMVTAQREVEEPIARLAQLARAVGIHLVVATQRPSVDVITGVIKANFPARIAFRVAMKVDSRTILDTNGAEMLLGQGDMLFQHPEEPAAIRLQGALLTSKETSRVIAHICKQPPPPTKLVLPVEPDSQSGDGSLALEAAGQDPLFMEAAKNCGSDRTRQCFHYTTQVEGWLQSCRTLNRSIGACRSGWSIRWL